MVWHDHSFVICAYGESPYLKDCIRSLQEQSLSSRIFMVTSTANRYIRQLAAAYQIPLVVREGPSSLAGDWNFAYQQADTRYVTLVHQDDLYRSSYLQEIYLAAGRVTTALLLFTDYCELRGGEYQRHNKLLQIKRFLLLPLKLPFLQKNKWLRRRILSLGNPICCPAVTFVKDRLPGKVFREGLSSNTDWEAWERLSKREGAFVYIPECCVSHRIHAGSTTTRVIAGRQRAAEDYMMFQRFWPKCLAAVFCRFYGFSEASNKTKE